MIVWPGWATNICFDLMIKLSDIQGWTVRQKILATLAYFDVFGRRLKLEELAGWLLGGAVSELVVTEALVGLENEVGFADDRYGLKNRGVFSDEDGAKYARQILARSEWLARVLPYVPFIKLVAVCNYSALEIADEHSDIDLLVVTKSGRIFLAKIFLTVLLHLLRVRRHGRHIAGRFCLSFYIAEDSLNLEDVLIENDVYMVYWMLALRPVYGDGQVWRGMWDANLAWLKAYFPKPIRVDGDFTNSCSWVALMVEGFLAGRLGDWMERRISRVLQKRFQARRHLLGANASVIVSETRLKYHNNDKRREYRDEFLKRLLFFDQFRIDGFEEKA